MTEEKPVKVIFQSRRIRAPEWAWRQGMDIASKHVTGDDAMYVLAADIAEAIYWASANLYTVSWQR